MRRLQLSHRFVAVLAVSSLLLSGCDSSSDDLSEHSTVDPALNGAWVSGVQSGPVKVYITELRFDDGSFEWTWDGDLQQRGVYDTENGVLSITIQSSYASPRRILGDLSRPYSVIGASLTWGGARLTRK